MPDDVNSVVRMERLHLSFGQLKEKIEGYNPGVDLWMLEKAYNIASIAHSLQNRVSGELYVMHPLEVAHILVDMELDIDSVVAALLHDVVEDTIYTKQDIKELFSESVSELVDGVTKLNKIPYYSKEEQQVENLRKMFLAMAKDIRVILIKLADRLHNMRTLKSMSRQKQLEKAKETLEIYAPIAHRLGISKIKWDLEDLCLRYLDPDSYHEISEKIAQKRKTREEYLANVQNLIKTKLSNFNIPASIEGRAKHFYSIYRKMKAQRIDVNQMYDLFGVRVIVNSISECYTVLGIVHELYKPVPGRFKDYIAMPKKNMYQSLHTTVICYRREQLEIQIRTWEMHQVAEVGIAAHWRYKEGNNKEDSLDSKLEWVRQMLELQKDARNSEEFLDNLKIDLFEDEIFVFSPKGDVINLPLGSTPIDFAYLIHTDIGHKTVGAKINQCIVPLNYKLQSGETVEIITRNVNDGPSRDWLKFTKTSNARKKINDWFKKECREENIMHGKLSIERELQRVGISTQLLGDPEILVHLIQKYSINSLDDLYAMIGYGGITSAKIVNRIREEYRKVVLPKEIKTYVKANTKKSSVSNNDIIIEGVDNCLIKMARCCSPVPGDKIVGFVTIGRGISIHTVDCNNIKNLQNNDKKSANRIIAVHWQDVTRSSYDVEIQISSMDRTDLILEITSCVSNLKIILTAITSRTTENSAAITDIKVKVTSTDQLDSLLKKLSQIRGVSSVSRIKNCTN